MNTNPERRTERYEIPAGDRAYIQDLNAADLAWYRQALERLPGVDSDRQIA